MSYIIGIDAGGTKTKALILTENKEIVFEVDSGYGNPNIDFEAAVSNILDVLNACLESPYGPQCKQVVAGIAGIEAGENRQKINQYLKQTTALPIILVNDAVLAYHSIFELNDGVLTIAGTGSISYGRNGEKEEYAGGWGHLLGDEGSSYDIAIQACKQIIGEKETGITYSPFSLSILNHLGMRDANELKGFIYQATKGEIASLSYIVYLQAKEGSQEAKEIFRKAGTELGNQTIRLIKKLGLENSVSIGCKGSLLEKNIFVQQAFQQTISKELPSSIFLESDCIPASGALAISEIYKLNR